MTAPRAAAVFRIVAFAEAASWTALLVAMLFKYVVADEPGGVAVTGPIHGVLFLVYLATVSYVREPLRWDGRTTLLAFAAGVPPLMSAVFERWATRTGRITTSPA